MKGFVVSSDIAYKLEFGNKYIRIYYGDSVVDEIASPYLTEDLFQLQTKQISDTMWIVHPLYHPRKLTRTNATTFSLDVIPFTNGPFLIRNDLIGYSPTPATMQYAGLLVAGSTGTLTCSNDFFDAGHAPAVTGDGTGALFKLVHKRSDVVNKGSFGGGTLPHVLCNPIDVKDTFSYTTHGTWTATVELQRNENQSTEAGGLVWETIKTTVGEADTNIQLSKVEDANNVQYRVVVTAYTSGSIRADITVQNSIVEGIVRVTGYTSAAQVTCEVISKLDPDNGTLATSRWAEGCWSYYRGFPASVTFFEDRCIYAGSKAIPILTTTA